MLNTNALALAAVGSIASRVLSGASLDLNFATNSYYPGGSAASALSTTRAQTVPSYAQTSSGLLVPFVADTPRITDQGLLVEEARTNLYTFSTPLIANLGASGGTIANGSAPALNPLPFATQWLTLGAPATLSFAYPPATLASATQYTVSAYVKMADNSAPNPCVGDQAGFDFAFVAANTTAGFSTPTVKLVYGSVYRVSATVTTGTVTVQNSGIVQYADMSGKSFQVSQFQLEAGAFATSPIPTSGGTATRNADVISLAGAASTASLAAKAAYVETNLAVFGTAPRLVEYAAGGGGNMLFASATQSTINGASPATATTGSGTIATLQKMAFAFDGSSVTAIMNGGSKATSASAWTAGTGPVYLGNRAAGDRALNGYMRRIAFSATKGQFDGLTV